MTSIRRFVLAVAGSVALTAAPALAGGFYVGAGVGDGAVEADISDGEIGEFEFDESDFAWKAYGGFRALKFFAIEAAYVDLGSPDKLFPTDAGDVTANVDVKGVSAQALGIIPLPWLKLFAKVGAVRWDAESSLSGGVSSSADDSGTDLCYGVGATLQFKKLGIRAEYEIFDVEGADSVSLLTAGLSWGF